MGGIVIHASVLEVWVVLVVVVVLVAYILFVVYIVFILFVACVWFRPTLLRSIYVCVSRNPAACHHYLFVSHPHGIRSQNMHIPPSEN